MAVVKKPNGSLRICIDPQPLNAALQREHYKLPTLDDVLPSLIQARVFSKLDVKQAYWHVQLDNESSLLITMITPFGRYTDTDGPGSHLGSRSAARYFKESSMRYLLVSMV
ncbi:Hypothetical predicted protein [Paramuricea clavata]|uniref:Uncharacterized protein n=1 Tax=Paramuricea clavata TaxID=317549 RepID=A0A7D9D7H2_PARCT|nr:Hypothetical predicted protein [Paramuricea clavata]